MTQVTGVITQRYDNENNVVLELNGQRYSDYKGQNVPADATKGATVSFDMIEKGVWKNVSGPVKVDHDAVAPDLKTGAAPVGASQDSFVVAPGDTRQRSIIRQSSLTRAIEFFSIQIKEEAFTQEQVVAHARYFESYADGSLDLKELDDALGGDDIAF